jgi:hypothetical protein
VPYSIIRAEASVLIPLLIAAHDKRQNALIYFQLAEKPVLYQYWNCSYMILLGIVKLNLIAYLTSIYLHCCYIFSSLLLLTKLSPQRRLHLFICTVKRTWISEIEVVTGVKIWTVIFSVVMLHSLVGDYQHFRGTYHLHLQDRYEMEVLCSSEMLVTSYKTTQCHNSEENSPQNIMSCFNKLVDKNITI